MLLLQDGHTVRKLRREAKDDEEVFVCRVFDNWLSQDDDCTVPCTWENLCSCIENTPDLPGTSSKRSGNNFTHKPYMLLHVVKQLFCVI